MKGEEIEVGVKLGYIKALFSLSRVTLKQVPAGSAAITSGPGVRMTHTWLIKSLFFCVIAHPRPSKLSVPSALYLVGQSHAWVREQRTDREE